MSSSAMNLDSNVMIRTINKYGAVTSSRCIHNKATYYMVEGLLKFLKGDFNSISEMTSYQPLNSNGVVRFGNIGVKVKDHKLESISSNEFKIPTFDDYKLQQDLSSSGFEYEGEGIVPIMTITTYDDPNNSAGLLIKTVYPKGYLTTRGTSIDDTDPYYSWTYDNSKSKKETIITELGLVSDSYLLARVLLDGAISSVSETGVQFENDSNPRNPIIQDEDSSLIVEWRIGLVALGQNDVVSTYVNSLSPNITNQSIPYTINSDRTIVTRNVKGDGIDQTWYYYIVFKIVDDKPKINAKLFKKIDNTTGEEIPLEVQSNE